MLLDSWQEHDLLECVAKAAPGNAEEDPRQQHCKSILDINKPKLRLQCRRSFRFERQFSVLNRQPMAGELGNAEIAATRSGMEPVAICDHLEAI